MSDRFRQRRHRPSTSASTSSCCTSCLLLLAAAQYTPDVVNGIFPRHFQRKPTSSCSSSSSSKTWHNWQQQQQPRGGSAVPSTFLLSPEEQHQDPTTPFLLGLADDEQELFDTFRNEIREIVAECHVDMLKILQDLKDNVRREQQGRKDQQKALLLEELSDEEDAFDGELDGGDEDVEGLIQLDVFSDLPETENLNSGAYDGDEDEILDDFAIGDTDEEDEQASPKVDDTLAVDEEEEMSSNLVFESVLEPGEEDDFVDLNVDDGDQELIELGSIAVKAKALKKHKKYHIKTQDATNIRPESAVNTDVSAVEEPKSDVVADGDEIETLVGEDWQSRRYLSKKRQRRKRHKAEAVDDDREDSVEAFVLTQKPSKFVHRFDLIARPLMFAMMGLLAAMVIYTIFDLVILYLASDASVFNKDQ